MVINPIQMYFMLYTLNSTVTQAII